MGFVQAAISNVYCYFGCGRGLCFCFTFFSRYNAFTWGLPHPSSTLSLLKRIIAEDKNSSYDVALEQLKVLIPEPSGKLSRPTRPAPRVEDMKPSRPAPRIEDVKPNQVQEEERKRLIDEL